MRQPAIPRVRHDLPTLVYRKLFSLPKVGLLDSIVFLAPLLRFAEIDVVGRLFLTDIVLAALLPFLDIPRTPAVS